MKKTKGFTLIELLVVIAIIGILAAIVLVSLTGARARARDARIMADLNQIRSSAEIIFSSDDSYANIVSNSDINSLMTDMTNQGGTNVLRVGNSAGYCVEVQLNNNRWGCVNSGLVSTFNLANNPACAGAANGAPTNISCQ